MKSIVDFTNEIKAYFATKQALTTKADSTEVNTINNFYGAKNLLPNYGKSQNINGVQITVASDGSYTVEGTNSGSYAEFELIPTGKGGFTLPAGTYKFSGVFATQSGATTGNMAIEYTDNTSNYCTGESSTFTLSTAKTVKRVRHSINVGTFHAQVYPMLRLASIADDTYVPYAKTNKELTNNVESEEGTITFNTANFTNNSSWVYKFGKTVSLQVAGTLQSTTVGSNIELMTLPFTASNVSSVSIPIGENGYATVSVMDNKVYIYTSADLHGWGISANLTFLTS